MIICSPRGFDGIMKRYDNVITKLDELEQFWDHRYKLGIRMMELKKVINKLYSRLGKLPRCHNLVELKNNDGDL